MLTDQELRQAICALQIIEERGDPDVFALIMREATADSPPGDGFNYLTLGTSMHIRGVARELSHMFGEPLERCEGVCLDVLAPSRQQLRCKALIGYAIELVGPCRELTGESLFVPYDETPATRAASGTRRPSTIRIVSEKEAVA